MPLNVILVIKTTRVERFPSFFTETVQSLSEEVSQETVNSVQVLETIGTSLCKTLAQKVLYGSHHVKMSSGICGQ